MKVMRAVVLLLLIITAVPTVASNAAKGDRVITKVVKMLEGMLEKSKADGGSDATLFAKFECYCKSEQTKKTEEVDKITTDITLLEDQIEKWLGSNGELSSDIAQLDKDMDENEKTRRTAGSLRDKEHADFIADEADMSKAIVQMESAIRVLSEVGADQTLQAAADHEKYMAGYKKESLIGVSTQIQQALSAVSVFLAPNQRRSVESFTQKPFTATYSSQSGEVLGILKNMLDTFESNLQAARELEEQQATASSKFMETMEDEFSVMQKSKVKKAETLGSNTDDLGAKRLELAEATKSKGILEDFLSELSPLCEKRAGEFAERQALRMNEDTAISEAIAVLNADSSFATFGKVAATVSTDSPPPVFLQLANVNVHRHPLDNAEAGMLAQNLLRKVSKEQKSQKLAKVAAMLEVKNPFTAVLEMIKKMLALIVGEGTTDAAQLKWCQDERQTNTDSMTEKQSEITALKTAITTLTDLISDPKTGLEAQIETTETNLDENRENQKTSTAQRVAENALYRVDISHQVKAQELLATAKRVLKKYYMGIMGGSQKQGEESKVLAGEETAVPTTWAEEGGYKGQFAGGLKVIGLLEFVISEAIKEETAAHKNEREAQHLYEDNMLLLTKSEKDMVKSLVALRVTLAEKKKDLSDAEDDLKQTTADLEAIEAYLLSIKPGCDFITDNIESRDSSRAEETKGLTQAEELLTKTPAYLTAVAEAGAEALGDCLDHCEKDSSAVACKACLAKVTIPGYCAGHPSTAGCS